MIEPVSGRAYTLEYEPSGSEYNVYRRFIDTGEEQMLTLSAEAYKQAVQLEHMKGIDVVARAARNQSSISRQNQIKMARQHIADEIEKNTAGSRVGFSMDVVPVDVGTIEFGPTSKQEEVLLKYALGTHTSIGNFATAYNTDMVKLLGGNSELMGAMNTLLNMTGTIGSAMNPEVMKASSEMARANFEQLGNVILQVQSSLGNVSNGIRQDMDKFKNDSLSQLSQMNGFLQKYSEDAHALTVQTETAKSQLITCNSTIEAIRGEMNIREQVFKDTVKLLQQYSNSVTATEKDIKDSKLALVNARAEFAKESNRMNNEVLLLTNKREELSLIYDGFSREMIQQREDFANLTKYLQGIQSTNSTLQSVDGNSRLMMEKVNSMSTAMITTMEKAIETASVMPSMVQEGEEMRKMMGSFITIMDELRKSINGVTLSSEGTKEEFKSLTSAVVSVSNNITSYSSAINKALATISASPQQIIASPGVVPPVVHAFDFERLNQAIRESMEESLESLEKRDNSLLALVQEIKNNFTKQDKEQNRATQMVLQATVRQSQDAIAILNKNVETLIEAAKRPLVAPAERGNDSLVSMTIGVTYFEPKSLEWLNRPGPTDRLRSERSARSMAASANRPNKRHSMITNPSMEPDPFVNFAHHVKKVRTQKQRREAKANNRRRKIGMGGRNNYIF